MAGATVGLVGYIYYACQTRESLVFIKSRKTLAESMDPLNPQNLKVSGEGGRNYKETRSPVTTTAPLLMRPMNGGECWWRNSRGYGQCRVPGNINIIIVQFIGTGIVLTRHLPLLLPKVVGPLVVIVFIGLVLNSICSGIVQL